MVNSSRILRCLVGLSCLLAVSPARAQAPVLGTVAFATSGPAEAHRYFIRGVSYMHSFEYDDAAEAFREAQRRAPDFAMAYWGEAMTYNHPIWQQTDPTAAHAALNRLAPTLEGRLAKAPTERERDYLAAVEVLYGEGDKLPRDLAYARAMRRLSEKYSDDPEAAAFYALAILGTSHGGRDIPTYMRAAAVAQEVLREHPNHPGAAHYLIHSYDDPIHAPLGLRAARVYTKIAPSAAHAQHMTSHIFVAMGMWDDVVAANETAVAVLNRVRDSDGLSPASCGHYPYWLVYGYLQQGRHEAARGLFARCRDDAVREPSGRNVNSASGMRAMYLVATGEWDGAVADMAVPESDGLWDSFAAAYGAIKRGDRLTANELYLAMHERLGTLESEVEGKGGPTPSAVLVNRIVVWEIRALMLLRDGRGEDAVNLMREAAATEAGMPFEFGPPPIAKPSFELLGEILLEIDQPAAAREAFEGALARAPRRTTSLLGLARAAERSGDRDVATDAYRELAEIWHSADSGIAEQAGR